MTEPATAEAPTPRSALSLLVSRSFGLFFAARLLTSTGVWLHGVVAAIAAFDATGSALAVGLVSVVQFAPQLVLAPLCGKWADRGDVKRQMLLGRTLSALGSAGLAAWYLFPADTPAWTDATAVATSSLAVGLGLVIGGPAMQSATPMLVSRDELPAAMALNTAPMTIGRIAGPAFGALATIGFGYGWAFLAAGVANLLFVALIAWIVFPPPPGREADERYSVREALAFVRSDRPVLLTLIGVTAVGFGSEPTVTLAPPLAAELGGGTVTVGALTTSMGIGAAVGVLVTSLLARRVRHDWAAFVGMSTMAVALASCALPLPREAVVAAFALSGLGFIMAMSSLSTLLQLRLPPLMRGRVMALWLMGFVGSRPLGALLVGALSDALTVYVAFGCVAVSLLVCAVVCRPARLRGTAQDQSPEDAPQRSVDDRQQ
ncbi:MFS transporter [Nocardiopsis synnemataformans]|uniref:MFS transporter n=1 Tax=Nocardiopsis synnemataformans TaxID=61305 RepID=UPI003EBDAD7E